MSNVAGNVHFTYAQLEGIWVMAGGNPTQAGVAAAVATAESGGNSTATNNNSNGTVDRGLWQINSVHGSMSTYDVMGNARAAVSISGNGSNWHAWVTFNNGAYRQFLQAAVPPDMTVPINATNNAGNVPGTSTPTDATLTSSSGPSGVDCIAPWNWGSCLAGSASGILEDIVGAILNPLINILAGIVGIVGGATLVLFGIIMIVMDKDTGSESVDLGALFRDAGDSLTGTERAALTRQQTAREQVASRERLALQPGRGEKRVAAQAAANREQAESKATAAELRFNRRGLKPNVRTKTVRSTNGNTTIYTTTREQINGQAKEYQR
jgi:hypothetical protein